MRRFTRLTAAHSKKAANHLHMLALYFMFYNFVKHHTSLCVSPAMAAGIETRLWEMSDIVALMDARAPGSRPARAVQETGCISHVSTLDCPVLPRGQYGNFSIRPRTRHGQTHRSRTVVGFGGVWLGSRGTQFRRLLGIADHEPEAKAREKFKTVPPPWHW